MSGPDERLEAMVEARGARALLSSAWAQLPCRFAVAGIFLAAALPKIGDAAAFARDIANFKLVPEAWVTGLAVAVPFIELLVAVLLVFGLATRAAALVGAGMLACFTIATATAVARGLDIECGCFGKGDGSSIGWRTVARDLAFLAPALVVLFFDRGRFGLASLWHRGTHEPR